MKKNTLFLLKSLHRSLECITLAKEINKLKQLTMKLLESKKQMIKTATKVQLENVLKETILLKQEIEKELKKRK